MLFRSVPEQKLLAVKHKIKNTNAKPLPSLVRPTEIYTLSLHDALPIWMAEGAEGSSRREGGCILYFMFSSEQLLFRNGFFGFGV